MTGQILSGVEPYIAARYQILVMTMVFSATGLTVFVFMYLLAKTNLSYLKSKN
ncbi:ABC transporter permease [Psychrosphaera algicola]